MNQYWPARYFVDAQGRIRDHQFGEGEYEHGEAVIQQLLIESRRRTLGRYGSEIAHQHHARILAAVEARDAEAAAEAMRRHIETNFEHLHESTSSTRPACPAGEDGLRLTPDPPHPP